MTGTAAGLFLYNAVRGIDDGIFEGPVKNPSMGSETTFENDTRDAEAISRTILQIAHQLMFRLLDEKKSARTLTLKIRHWDFVTFTVSKTESRSFTSAEQILKTAKTLLDQKWDKRTPIRLIGLSLSGLESFNPHEQQDLFGQDDEKTHKLEKAILEIKARFPDASPVKASLLRKNEKKRE
jgi:DNA polymerase-4